MNAHIQQIFASEKDISDENRCCHVCRKPAVKLWPVGSKLCAPLCAACMETEKYRLLVALGMAQAV